MSVHSGSPAPAKHNFGSPLRAALGGARDALGAPAVVLGASFVGFGALVRQSDMTLLHGLVSTASGWALPGQIALVELYAAGASLFAITIAVGLSNARLLPMTVALMPLLRTPRWPRWAYYAIAHLVAVTGWAAAMRACPNLPREERLPYFTGFAAPLWLMTIVTTAVGFFLAGSVPASVSLGLVFLNPVYFLLIFAADANRRLRALALGLGAASGPVLHALAPSWGLLLTGLLAGTAAFLLDRLWARRHV